MVHGVVEQGWGQSRYSNKDSRQHWQHLPPSPQSLCMPCGPSLPSLRPSNHQKPLASVKGGKGRRAEGGLVWALQEP